MAVVSDKTVKALLAHSGNKCAFPGCSSIVVDTQQLLVAQLAHIEAVSEQGPRYNPEQTDEDRHGYDNLMFLCYPHHREIDVVENKDRYSVKKLKEMKGLHEKRFLHDPFQIDASHIYRITQEINDFWAEISNVNQNHPHEDLKFEIDAKASFSELYEKALDSISRYNNMWDSCISEKDKDRYWELFNLGMNNHSSSIRLTLLQMHIKYLEEYLKTNVNDTNAKNDLKRFRDELRGDAGTAIHWD